MFSEGRLPDDERVHLLVRRASGKVASRYALCGAGPVRDVVVLTGSGRPDGACDECARAAGM